MILQELHRYYERKEAVMPQEGYAMQKISFVFVIDKEGSLVEVVPREREEESPIDKSGKTKKVKSVDLVDSPAIPERSGISAHKKVGFIVENSEYILGYLAEINEPKKAGSYEEKLQKCFRDTRDEGIRAILAFISRTKSQSLEHSEKEKLQSILQSKVKPIIDFRLDGIGKGSMWKESNLREWYRKASANESEGEFRGDCLLTGEKNAFLARLHGSVKIGIGQTAGISLVSFNEGAFESYGKDQSYNAPVSQEATRKYMTALRALTNPESKNRVKLGETIYLFWAEKDEANFERLFFSSLSGSSDFFEESDIDLSEEEKQKQLQEESAAKERKNESDLKNLIQNSATGSKKPLLKKFADSKDETRFFVLGITANAARLVIREWYQDSVYELAERIHQHYEDIEIEGQDSSFGDPSIWQLLRACIRQGGKLKDLPPKLIPDLMHAVLTGESYPRTLLNLLINRIKADQKINQYRAGLLKAYYCRLHGRNPHYPKIKKDMDENETNIGYRLGRLFATLEKAQEDASDRTLNSTIKDRFYASASANPSVVFPTLLRLSIHHQGDLRKNKPNSRNYQKVIQEILEPVSPSSGGFPRSLPLQDQGLFALGYYHQRQRFFKKKEQESTQNTNEGEQA
ncbi:MAG: type I-C CRISPR-associated protein Cas8c/Csd1 [Candidatus Caenarcaniphilales bacterium]|nr:type I-C CRISPR-associated protein Cas8c/Csd1 [Candidatus Caenarcaniphilales bacterium]